MGNNIHYYTHAPYSINLCHPFNATSKKNKETKSWSLELLKHDLNITNSISGRGVVVHVGKSNDLDIPSALDAMYMCIVDD